MNERAVHHGLYSRPRKQLGLMDAQMDCPWRLLISVRDGRGQGPVSGKVASMRVEHWCR
jgi:hypothetical protein